MVMVVPDAQLMQCWASSRLDTSGDALLHQLVEHAVDGLRRNRSQLGASGDEQRFGVGVWRSLQGPQGTRDSGRAVWTFRAGFTGERRARMRLSELYALDVLDRFRPQAWGKPSPYHWVLGPLGAAVVAAEHGTALADLSWRRSLAHDLAASQRLAHLVGLNGFFTSLLRSARTRPCCALDEWWSERRCAREWGEVVRPDGYGVWSDNRTSLAFLVEYDNGTERLDRLASKLDGYAKLAAAAGHPNWVLFTFAGPRREAEARRVLAHPTVPVATTARVPGATPDGTVWLPVTSTGHRLRLVQLASLPINGR